MDGDRVGARPSSAVDAVSRDRGNNSAIERIARDSTRPVGNVILRTRPAGTPMM